MTDEKQIPLDFRKLQSEGFINKNDILRTPDGFWMIYKSVSDILSEKGIIDFPGPDGKRLECGRFYDDWFIYAVSDGDDFTYSLLKLREQEHDIEKGLFADGDTPGVTISFISFNCEVLFQCFENPSDENRIRLDDEINRVAASRGQIHHEALKKYFMSSKSEGAYLVADTYVKHIVSFISEDRLDVPEHYKETVRQNNLCKTFAKWSRLPRFIESLNREAGYTVCDNEKIYIKNKEKLNGYEAAAILATHTGNTSVYSFAAEVEFHAKFLIFPAKIRIPFLGRSIYDSAIRADMSIGDAEFQGPAPFYREASRIVKRQQKLHLNKKFRLSSEIEDRQI